MRISHQGVRRIIQELQRYYAENKGSLPDYRDRGIPIPETREPGAIHHARLGITFISDIERGKPTSELGKALRLANLLGMDCLLIGRNEV